MSSSLTARSLIYFVLKLLQEPQHYSVRRLFTGLAIAALVAWKLIVRNAIRIAVRTGAINTPAPICILYAKSFNHAFMAHQVTGTEIIKAIPTNNKNSFDTSSRTCCTDAPNTF